MTTLADTTFDYIIVGAGSAGCVLANRLSENPDKTVLLIESGGRDNSVFIQMPSALYIPMNMKKYNWQYESEPEPYLDGRRLECPRGKVLGGSSSINGMVYVRGHARDFDEWADEGATNWDYAHCLPYFKKLENWMHGEDDYRGASGPMAINNGNQMQNPLYKAFIKAGTEAGYPFTHDYNGAHQEGFGAMHMTVKDGVRWSSANAYLKPALSRPNLTVLTHTLVLKVLIRDRRAIGVNLQQGQQSFDVYADNEVISSAGPIGSPHLLQRSGIGPVSVLKSAGIEVIHALPGVGENLQDHLEFYFQFKCHQPITLNGQLSWWRKGLIGARWLTTKKGLGATNHFESCGFIRSKAGVEWPDLQYHFLPAAMRYDGRTAFDGHGFQVHIGHNKPKSRGWVRAESGDVMQKPKIQFNYLSHQEDIEAFRACVRLTREIIMQPAMDAFRGDEIQPVADVTTDEQIDAFVRQSVESAYHPSCSCKMGTDDMAVVTPSLNVRGIDGLRVVDSSVFPTITNGNLNAPTLMLAERAADIITKDNTLSPLAHRASVAENWQTMQRSTVV